MVRETLVDGFRGSLERTFFHGHSYTGNQLGCAAALANLAIFDEEQTLRRIREQAEVMRRTSEAFWKFPQVGDVRQEGTILAIELVKDRATREPFAAADRLAHRINEEARQLGLLTRGLGATLFLLPPYCATDEELEQMVAILLRATGMILG